MHVITRFGISNGCHISHVLCGCPQPSFARSWTFGNVQHQGNGCDEKGMHDFFPQAVEINL